jgi:hypothetical protein
LSTTCFVERTLRRFAQITDKEAQSISVNASHTQSNVLYVAFDNTGSMTTSTRPFNKTCALQSVATLRVAK